ncbi:MAG: LuxR C-terminal-related transcriptional regulator [Paracoccaceae bacterium]
MGEKRDAMFLTSYSESYAHGFFDNGFYLRTAMFRWSVQNTGACSWGWAWKERKAGRLSDDEIVTLEANWRVGIRAGYTLSFGTIAPLYRGAMGLAAPSDVSQTSVDRFWDDFGAEILTASNMVHLKITQLPNAGQYPALTPRQREVLRWVADGKTTQDIATLLGLSVGTVEKHLRLARDTLGVETTAHAVAKASFLNQLNYG